MSSEIDCLELYETLRSKVRPVGEHVDQHAHEQALHYVDEADDSPCERLVAYIQAVIDQIALPEQAIEDVLSDPDLKELIQDLTGASTTTEVHVVGNEIETAHDQIVGGLRFMKRVVEEKCDVQCARAAPE